MKRIPLFLVAFACLMTPLTSLRAGTLASLTDTVTNQTVSAFANHEIRYVNSDSIDHAGESIIIGFAEAFSLATITPSDVSFSHGPTTGLETTEVLSATAGTNIWGMDITGTTLRLSPPTNTAAGELPANDKVVIKIGTNTGGTHQIQNPSSAGSYAVIFYGDYGGMGTVRIPITTASSNGFEVSFTVPEPVVVPPVGTPDSGCGAGCAPTVPPTVYPELIIGAVTVTEVTASSARVSWKTSAPAESSLSFLDASGGESLVSSSGLGTNHVANLTGLTPATAYLFILRATIPGQAAGHYGPGMVSTLGEASLVNVQGFQAVREATASIQLSWTVPAEARAENGYTIVVVARTDRYPTSADDGRRVFSGFGTSAVDTYTRGAVYYAAFAQQAGRSSSGAVTALSALAVLPTLIIPPPEPTTPTPIVPPVRPRPTPPARPVVPLVTPGGPDALPAVTPTSSPISVLPQPTITLPVGTASSTTQTSSTVPTLTPSRPGVFQVETEWKTENGAFLLGRGEQAPRILAGDAIQLTITSSPAVSSGRVEVDGSFYALAQLSDGRYQAAFIPSNTSGAIRTQIILRLASGEERTLTRNIEVVSPAQIIQHDNKDEPAAGARVGLSIKQKDGWKMVAGGERTLSENGLYRQYLMPGTYQILVEKEGWKAYIKEFTQTTTGPFQARVVLNVATKNPLEAIRADQGILQNIAGVAAATLEIVRTPESQAVAQVAAPVAVIAAAGVTVAAASAVNVLAYLQFLLTQPLLLFRRRRREKWGVVYNALTKRPIDLAIVRLMDAKTGALRQTKVTDAQGRFAFLAPAGSYRLQVAKAGLVFPSAFMASETMDIDFVDLYHGEQIDVQASVTITPNIPLDPVEKMEMPKDILRRKHWRTAQHVISAASLGVAAVAVVVQPTPSVYVFAALQVGIYLLFRRLAIPLKPKNWGIAYDGRTRKPLKQAIVRIFDKKYNKLLETQLTDREGKYAFLAGKNVYYVMADHPGYDRFVSKDIDLRAESVGVVHEPLALLAKQDQNMVPPSVVA